MRHIFQCIDAHTCGNPVRLVKTGMPELEGNNMREKRLHFIKDFDWIRTGLMFEPRGHDMMSGSMLYPPHDQENDAAVLFIETSGCLPMCGHGTIGTVTIAIQEGLLKPKQPGTLRLETPAGLVKADYDVVTVAGAYTKVKSVRITNVPSYLHLKDITISCEDLGNLVIDVAFGGNFYAIIDIQENFRGIDNYPTEQLISWGREIRKKINDSWEIIHPGDSQITGCSHILWAGEIKEAGSSARNAVIYGEKAIDRSPCGTGTSARMAQWYAKGKLKKGESFIHESIIGSKFTGKIEGETKVGNFDAIIPSIEGWACVYGYNTIWIDTNDDPYAMGFQVI